jgi:DNA modification methylase
MSKWFEIEPHSVMHFNKNIKERYYFERSDLDVKQFNAGVNPNSGRGEIRLSEFNWQLCEWITEYWSKEGDVVVDPFAGRVTRGSVISDMGRKYIGYEISPQTYNRSIEHYKKWGIDVELHLGDGRYLAETETDSADCIITCPPYFNVEQYESVEGQLSDRLKYDEFLEDIYLSIQNCKRVLKYGGFGCWVVGDFRNFHRWRGFLSFHSDVINIIKEVGLKHWDTIILPSPPSPIMGAVLKGAKQRRYTAKLHEYLIIFKNE